MEAGSHILAIVALLSVSVSVALADIPNFSQNEKLRKKLLKDYDKLALPHRDQNGTTAVEFGIVINGIRLDEDQQTITLNTWTQLLWQDPRLTWDYKDYGGLKILHLGDHEVWQPDITLYNNAEATEIDHYGNVHVVVYPDGKVLWVPPSIFRARCPIDLTYWPYDTQRCTLLFGSWTKNGWELDLQLLHNRTQIYTQMFMMDSHKWQFVEGTLHRRSMIYKCCPEPYVSMEVTLTIRRVSPSFASTVIVPALVISLLTLVQFLLPLRETKRVTVGCVSTLLTLIALFYVANSLPSLSYSAPIIVKFYGQALVMVLLSVGVSAAVLRLTDAHHPAASTPPPALLKTILTGPLGSIMFLQKYMGKVGHSGGGADDAEVLDEVRPVSYAHEWLLVAAAVDRVAALTFVVAFVITLIAYTAAL
ncbi:neuronal acetylcholine receptor subunit alpha-6-like [Penaeus japonicus]|uniref:neuronal acetylcholine receptor subunit alpha-6-like n=1 Tax=Penaeus japonicus TaxID=27405 RepID=UPI001C712E3E|nr:neuronal acetylcholine receptor subunit alpha-6-like [Penaeus japonicus]